VQQCVGGIVGVELANGGCGLGVRMTLGMLRKGPSRRVRGNASLGSRFEACAWSVGDG